MKVLIVGAGFSGAVLARELAEAGHDIVVIDKRTHIGGNAHDYTNELGIRVHTYGPHLFHTNNKRVWDWLSQFTEWVPYKHQVQAQVDGDRVILPPNQSTLDYFGSKEKMIDRLYRPYTKKMWGLELDELDPGIAARVKPRTDDNIYYFPNDAYQGQPRDGWTAVFEHILDHPNIYVSLRTAFNRAMLDNFDWCYNSMPIDEYHDYCYGHLPYRSIKFHHVNVPLPEAWSESNATLNFSHDEPYTRVTEWKKIPEHGNNPNWTTLTYEEPCDYRSNNLERYYPVKDVAGVNRDLYKRYNEIATPKMTFIGRCGKYVYIDMHQAINASLQLAEKIKNDI